MTETYLQKLTKERKARLNRFARAAIKEPVIPLQVPAPPTEEPLPDCVMEPDPEVENILNRKEVLFQDIFKASCRHYGVSMLDVISARRSGKIVIARHVIAFLALQHTKCTTGVIASRLARDHSTILYALNRMKTLSQTDAIAADIAAIKKALQI